MLCCKRNDAGVTAKCRRNATGVIVIRCHQPAGGFLFDMAVRLDTTGKDILSACIDLVISIAKFFAYGDDLSIFNTNISAEGLRRIGDSPVTDLQIKIRHLNQTPLIDPLS